MPGMDDGVAGPVAPKTAPSPLPRVLDGVNRGALDQLEDALGRDGTRDLVEECRRQIALFASEMAAAVEREDVARIGALAHDLKSNTLTIGLAELGEHAAAIELACRERRGPDALRLARQIFRYRARAETALALLWAASDTA